jgi:Methyltransferase domain
MGAANDTALGSRQTTLPHRGQLVATETFSCPEVARSSRLYLPPPALDGPGALAVELAGRVGEGNVAAIDPAPEFVAACQARVPGVDVREGVGESLPWDDGTFDAVHPAGARLARARNRSGLTTSDRTQCCLTAACRGLAGRGRRTDRLRH